ncbi:MAG: beta-galactosidase, partial [Chloroflexi bacterium]|nr:beta-galactosidase [Chloroflexota bacterium]
MKRHPWVEGLCTVVCSLALMAVIAGMAKNIRGVETGLEAKAPRVEEPRLGTNISLEQYPSEVALREVLRQARSLGIGTLRQRLPWAEVEPERGAYRWEVWDRLLPVVAEAGFRVILVLDTSPAWARPPWEANNPLAPPADLADYARFAGAVAARYGRYI